MLQPIHEIFLWEDAEKDNSFKEKENFFTLLSGGIRFSQAEAREIWLSGKKTGFEMGLNYDGGSAINLVGKIQNGNHRLFYIRFLRLCAMHNLAIQWHPQLGMMFRELDNRAPKNGHDGVIYCKSNPDGFTQIIHSSKSLKEAGIDETVFRAEFKLKCAEEDGLYMFDSNDVV